MSERRHIVVFFGIIFGIIGVFCFLLVRQYYILPHNRYVTAKGLAYILAQGVEHHLSRYGCIPTKEQLKDKYDIRDNLYPGLYDKLVLPGSLGAMKESLVVYPSDDLLGKREELRLYFIFYYEESRAFVCINRVPHM